jgi:hypothetical protein
VSSAKARIEGDFQLVVPNIPIDSAEKQEIDYELVLQVTILKLLNTISLLTSSFNIVFTKENF